MSGGLRYDGEKERYDLIPYEWEQVLAQILTAGAKKYAARNWEKGMDHGKMIACARRHIRAYQRGERYDSKPDARGNPGTGAHHLGQAAWNLLALMYYDINGLGTSDMPSAPQIDVGLNSYPLPTQIEPENPNAKDD